MVCVNEEFLSDEKQRSLLVSGKKCQTPTLTPSVLS